MYNYLLQIVPSTSACLASTSRPHGRSHSSTQYVLILPAAIPVRHLQVTLSQSLAKLSFHSIASSLPRSARQLTRHTISTLAYPLRSKSQHSLAAQLIRLQNKCLQPSSPVPVDGAETPWACSAVPQGAEPPRRAWTGRHLAVRVGEKSQIDTDVHSSACESNSSSSSSSHCRS